MPIFAIIATVVCIGSQVNAEVVFSTAYSENPDLKIAGKEAASWLKKIKKRRGVKLVKSDEILLSIEVDGFLKRTWTKLDTHSKQKMSYGNVFGAMISWDDKLICSIATKGQILSATEKSKAKPLSKRFSKKNIKWKLKASKNKQFHSVVLTPNSVIVGGIDYSSKTDKKGFIIISSREAGQEIQTIPIDSPLCYNGLAIANNKIYATLENGSVVCVGK